MKNVIDKIKYIIKYDLNDFIDDNVPDKMIHIVSDNVEGHTFRNVDNNIWGNIFSNFNNFNKTLSKSQLESAHKLLLDIF